MISADVRTSVETIELLNETCWFEELREVQVWTNGTRIHLARHYYYNQLGCLDAWVNGTTWLDTNAAKAEAMTPPTVTGRLPEFWNESSDWMYFLGHANNGTHFTSYAHDNNYERYYPYEWDLIYNMLGAVCRHVHLSNSLVNSWIWGNITSAAVQVLAFYAGFCLEELITMTLEQLGVAVGEVLSAPLFVAISVLLTVADFIDMMAQVLGYVTTAMWVSDTVKEHFGGDGWMWRGPLVTLAEDVIVRNFYYLNPITDWRWYEARFWNQSWGTQGIFYHQEFCTLWCSRSLVKAAAPTWEPAYSRAGNGPFR
jgi:hypothetical protein